MAFIRRSGINPLLASLRRHCERGRPLRVLTTTYTGSTERAALDELTRDLGADVRISYDLSTTRLHAKAWIFHRRSGFSTAYIGSSNLTHSAQVTGLEWNVRASAARNPDVLAKFDAVFESYWQSGDFVPYDPDEFDDGAATEPAAPIAGPTSSSARSSSGRAVPGAPARADRALPSARPPPQPARRRHRHRQDRHGRGRLRALRDRLAALAPAVRRPPRGDPRPEPRHLPPRAARRIVRREVGRRRTPDDASSTSSPRSRASTPPTSTTSRPTTSMSSSSTSSTTPPRRRTASSSTTSSPRAARPDRHAGAQRRPPDPALVRRPHRRRAPPVGRHRPAPPRRRSCTSASTTASTSRDIPWRRGQRLRHRGPEQRLHQHRRLGSPRRASRSPTHAEPPSMRCLGFCVSIEHARFMAEQFNRHGVAAVAVWGDSPPAEREAALRDLAAGTDPRRVLGRSLQRRRRRARRRHRAHAAPDREPDPVPPATRPRTASSARQDVLHRPRLRRHPPPGVPLRPPLPRARSAAPVATSNERGAAASRSCRPAATWSSTRRQPRSCCAACVRRFRRGGPLRSKSCASLRAAIGPTSRSPTFLDESGLELDDVYDGNTRLVRSPRGRWRSGPAAGPARDASLRRALGRLLHVDDARAHRAPTGGSSHATSPRRSSELPERERRLAPHARRSASWHQALTKDASLQEPSTALGTPPGPCRAAQLLDVLDDRVDHLHGRSTTHPTSRCRCTPATPASRSWPRRDSAATAKVAAWQSGVLRSEGGQRRAVRLHPRQEQRRLLAHDPLPRLRDQSRRSSTGRASRSPGGQRTGQRYRNHEQDGRSILLFTRLRADDRAFWFLGPATYAATSVRSRWRSRGSWTRHCPATSISRSPPRWRDWEPLTGRVILNARKAKATFRAHYWLLLGLDLDMHLTHPGTVSALSAGCAA